MPRLIPALILCLIGFCAPVLAQNTAAPQDEGEVVSNGQKFGAWTVSCVAIAVGQTNCTLTQRVLRATDSAFVSDIVAARNAEGATFLVARVPVGVFLPTGFAMREAANEDEADVLQFTWQTCNQQICEALVPLDASDVTAFSAEDNAMIAAFRPSAQSEPFVFQVSLNGLAAGLAAIGQ
ncbi:MAG: invasion associated locus B family protein [Sulfitobacter sp.]